MKGKIYLDYAAATPMDAGVLEAMKPYQTDKFYNPSSLYLSARQVRLAVEAARAKAAKVLGAKPAEVVFTAGATESVNLAIRGVAAKFPRAEFVALTTEHHAVLESLKGLKSKLVKVNAKGLVELSNFEAAISDWTVLVSVAYANNEIGTIQPLNRIGQLIKQIRESRQKRGVKTPIYLHTDASQAAASLSLAVDSLGVDLLTLSGGKIYGPAQSGLLYVRRGVELEPILYGGGQERGLRSGTESAAAAVGLATALDLAQARRDKENQRLGKLRDVAVKELISVAGVSLNGDEKHRLSGNINLTVDGVDGETMVMYLDEAGFEVSTGAACTTGSSDPSHVLLAIGLTPKQANSSLRITLGRESSKSDIEKLTAAFPKVAARLRQLKQN